MPRPKKDRLYFTTDTEEAIIQYNVEGDELVRSKLYETRIKYPFEKLAENVINTFKFPYIQSVDLQDEVVHHLVLNMDKYQADKGKAFSYFSIVAKNYLILNNDKSYKLYKKQTSIDDTEFDIPDDSQQPSMLNENEELMTLLIEFWDTNVNRYFKKKKDAEIAGAIIELFRRCKDIEDFNKKSLYVMIRDMTGGKTQHITKIISKMKDVYFKQRNRFHTYGDIDSTSMRRRTLQMIRGEAPLVNPSAKNAVFLTPEYLNDLILTYGIDPHTLSGGDFEAAKANVLDFVQGYTFKQPEQYIACLQAVQAASNMSDLYTNLFNLMTEIANA